MAGRAVNSGQGFIVQSHHTRQCYACVRQEAFYCAAVLCCGAMLRCCWLGCILCASCLFLVLPICEACCLISLAWNYISLNNSLCKMIHVLKTLSSIYLWYALIPNYNMYFRRGTNWVNCPFAPTNPPINNTPPISADHVFKQR